MTASPPSLLLLLIRNRHITYTQQLAPPLLLRSRHIPYTQPSYPLYAAVRVHDVHDVHDVHGLSWSSKTLFYPNYSTYIPNGVIVSHQIQDEMAKLQTTSFKILFKTLCLHCKPQIFGRKLRSIDSRLAPSFHNLFPARQLTVLFLLLPIFVALGHANRRVSTWPSSGRSLVTPLATAKPRGWGGGGAHFRTSQTSCSLSKNTLSRISVAY